MPTGGDGTAYMGEKMDLKKADMGDVIKDFYKSDAPQFKGRSKEKRREMAIAAKLEADEVKEGVGSVVKGAVKFLAKKAIKYPVAGAVGLGAATGTNLVLMKKELDQNLPKKDKSKELFYKEENIQEILDKKDVPHIKKLIKKLKDGSELHAKQSKDLEVALKTEDTAIESELLIQDWNKDDIKFTEVESIDIIKPEPLKPTRSNWREDLDEDWQKENRKDKTDGLSKKAVKAYRRENPGSKLQTAVTTKPSKLKKGSKSAKRRLSFCRRMKGMKKKLTSAKTRRDPDSRINKALRRWNC